MAQGSGDEFIPDDTPRSPKEEGPKKKARRASSTGTAKKSKQRRNCKYGERTLTRKALAEMAVYGPPKQYDIPYFAHQQLDPNCYPFSVGMPIGGPPAQLDLAGGSWESESDSDTDSDFFINFDYNSDEELTTLPNGNPSQSDAAQGPPNFNSKSYRHQRLSGGRPPLAKKVTADLDSDDELIVKMKQAKYLEKDIAARLVAEGRTSYQAKTIGTRWSRIKRVLQQRQDELLDQDLTDWHEGDDDVLAQAVIKAEADIERAKQAAEEKKWRLVADHMKSMKPVVDFSQNACRNRFEALANGTAKSTPESIENPDENILARIQSRIDKENDIKETAAAANPLAANVQGNGWNSTTARL